MIAQNLPTGLIVSRSADILRVQNGWMHRYASVEP